MVREKEQWRDGEGASMIKNIIYFVDSKLLLYLFIIYQ